MDPAKGNKVIRRWVLNSINQIYDDPNLVVERQLWSKLGYKIREIKDIKWQYKQIREILKQGQKVYVKPAAFRWFPVDMSHTQDAYGVDLQQSVEVSKEELERAKKLLILAGGAALLT